MDRLYYQSCLVPAGTLQASPASFPLPLEDASLKRGNVTVPDGHNGLTGIKILWSNQQIWPWSNNQFLVANNRVIPFDFDDYMTVTGLVIQAYNTDVFAHTFYIEMVVSDTPTPRVNTDITTATPAVVPDSSLSMSDPLSPDALIASLPPDIQPVTTADLVSA